MWIHQLHILALLSCISWLRAFQHPAPVQGSYRIHPTARTVLFSTTTAAPIADGIVKTVSKSGQGDQVNLGDIATVKYSCYLPNEKSAPFAKARQQKIAVGDGTMIQGWDKAIRTMKVGERAVIRISDPSLGYGDTGFPPLIPPRAEIEIDLEILDSQSPTTNIDFDNLAMADNTPRTAEQIAAAYDARRAQKALEGPEKEGLEGFLAKAKNFYFFGLFEGETGQKAPWFLRPSITFPIAFLIVGAAFYVSYLSGAITERGAQVTDELDEIILSSSSTGPANVVLAFSALFSSGVDFM